MRNFILKLEEREYMLKPGKVKWASLFRLRKQKKGTDVKTGPMRILKGKCMCVVKGKWPIMLLRVPVSMNIRYASLARNPQTDSYKWKWFSNYMIVRFNYKRGKSKSTCLLITKVGRKKYMSSIPSVSCPKSAPARLNLSTDQLGVLWPKSHAWWA